jgi:hypothetical protein
MILPVVWLEESPSKTYNHKLVKRELNGTPNATLVTVVSFVNHVESDHSSMITPMELALSAKISQRMLIMTRMPSLLQCARINAAASWNTLRQTKIVWILHSWRFNEWVE